MFQVNSKSSLLESLLNGEFNFTSDSYFSNIEASYRTRIINQRKLLEDKNLCEQFISNFRHPESNSIIGEMHAINGYRKLKSNRKLNNLTKYITMKICKYLHPFSYAERDFIKWNYSQYERSNFGYSNYTESIKEFGNPPVMNTNAQFKWNLRWLRYLYLRERLFSTFKSNKLENINSIIDIGGCYGGFISLLAESLPKKNYTLVDLGENIPLAAYYISSVLKGKSINIINSSSDKLSIVGNEINLIPAHLFSVVSKKNFDLCCNYVSLGEMSIEHFNQYIYSDLYKNSKYKHIVNRISSAPYFTKGSSHHWSNIQTIFDYDLSGDIKYFDIFPFGHFFPLIESTENKPIICSLKKLKALRSSWKRCPVSSQQFECIIES